MLVRASLIALATLATPALAEEIACEGAFGIDSSEARLVELYGADDVLTGEVPGPEGTTMIATRVFPDQPKQEMTFVWWDEDGFADLSNVDLPAKLTAPGGVRVGQTVAEVEALNGGPFDISGFGWDYGGYADLGEGKLADLPGGCSLSVRFALPDAYPDSVDATSIMGDGIMVPSDEALLETLDVRVSAVALGYPHPDFRD